MKAKSVSKKVSSKPATSAPVVRIVANVASAASLSNVPATLIANVRDAKAFVAEHGHVLEGLSRKRVRISTSVLAEHAETLLKIAIPYRAQLLAVGLAPHFLDELPMRVSLARSCQSLRQVAKLAYAPEEQKAIEACQKHRDEMMRICRFAFRAQAHVQQTLTSLQEGEGVRDLGEDSKALRVIILEQPEVVRATGHDPDALVNTAIALEDGIAHISADRTIRVKGGLAEVMRRNQSVHYLLQALREVRDCAAFALSKDQKILDVLAGLGAAWQKKAAEAIDETDETDQEDDEDPTPVE